MPNQVEYDIALRKLEKAKRASKQHQLAGYQSGDGIIRFVVDILGATPTAYQADILRHFAEHRRVAVRALHGVGKSTVAAWCVLWLMSVFDTDVKVVTTASAWRQLTHYLWPEIHKWARGAKWEALGLTVRPERELLGLSLKTAPNREAFAAASSDPSYLEGAHATVVAYIFDEAKAIQDAVFDAAEGAFSNAGEGTGKLAFALAISTPADTTGRFYDIHQRKAGLRDWWARHVTLQEALDAGQISAEWVEARRLQWGENDPRFQNRVLGEFASSAESTVIPLAWVEAAIERWHALGGKGDGVRTIGVDPSGQGSNSTAIADLRGDVLHQIHYVEKDSPTLTAGRINIMTRPIEQVAIAVDATGIGAGVASILLEQKFNVFPVNAAGKAAHKQGKNVIPMTDESGTLEFINMRAALWWLCRDALNPERGAILALPDDDRLVSELTTPRWFQSSTGKIQVESKADIAKRLGGTSKSTDGADALMLALYAQRGIITLSHVPAKRVSVRGLYNRRKRR